MIRALVITLALAGPAGAIETAGGDLATLRAIDKVTGTVEDLTIAAGESAVFGRMAVDVGQCRYPVTNPSGDAFAWVVVRMEGAADPAFQGWMIASAPALDALDHPRYDVWLLRCTTS